MLAWKDVDASASCPACHHHNMISVAFSCLFVVFVVSFLSVLAALRAVPLPLAAPERPAPQCAACAGAATKRYPDTVAVALREGAGARDSMRRAGLRARLLKVNEVEEHLGPDLLLQVLRRSRAHLRAAGAAPQGARIPAPDASRRARAAQPEPARPLRRAGPGGRRRRSRVLAHRRRPARRRRSRTRARWDAARAAGRDAGRPQGSARGPRAVGAPDLQGQVRLELLAQPSWY
jgi:hypothetical protein